MTGRADARCIKTNCGGTIEAMVVEFGRVVYRCARCERKKARLCRDCSGRTPSTRHWRCTTCARAQRRLLGKLRDRERYASRKPSVSARWKARMQDPAFRAHRAAYMADYRRTTGRTDFDRLYAREYMRRRRASPDYRRKQNKRKRELRALRTAA